MADKKYDVAIIGAGFSGPILAAKIAEHGVNPRNGERLTIALLDAGPYFPGTHRAGYGSPLRRRVFTNLEDGYERNYEWDDPYLAKMVGGSSLHWGAVAILPTPADYLHWQKETGVDWTEENLRAGVAEIRREFNIHPFPEQINTRGNRLFFEVAKQMGYNPYRGETARRNCIYCGYCMDRMMCKYDSRSSTLGHYLPTAEKFGVEIIPETYVEKINIEARAGRGIARSLACRTGGSNYEIQADKIIVCAGFTNTPLLLMRSGYGPREWRGNPILVENANIGKHIDGQPPTPGVSGWFDEPLGDGDLGSVGGYTMIHDSRPDAEGRLRLNASFGTAQLPSQAAMSPFAPAYGRAHKQFMREKGILRAGNIGLLVTKPSGRWQIGPDGKLVYGGDHRLTLQRFQEGREMARGILEKMGARKIVGMDTPVNLTPQTRGQHRVGSCRAGVDPKTSVVNLNFESHDVDNLLIGDASVIPRVNSGNSGTPQASVTVFAAGRIIERHFKR